MQNSFEQRIADFIAKRNNESYIKRKVSLSFLMLMVIGILCGIAVFDAVFRFSDYSPEYVSLHFGKALKSCVTFSDYFSEILNASKTDIRNIFFIFIAGFTYFCYPACGIIVLAKGFLGGFTVFYLVEVFKKCYFANENLLFLSFVVSRLLLSIIAIYLAMTAYVFSYKFREIKSNSSVLRRAPITYKYIFIFIYSVGGVLLVNSVYYLFIYNILK